jgi:DNA-binding PadR family transcriptional regulator
MADPAPKSDLPQGTLDLLILKVVAVQPVHGYAIAQRLQQISRDIVQVPGGSLYPALHRLENRGFVKSEWKETDSGESIRNRGVRRIFQLVALMFVTGSLDTSAEKCTPTLH